jgi:hypothetical protein
VQHGLVAFERQAGHFGGDGQAGPEPVGLDDGAIRELRAGGVGDRYLARLDDMEPEIAIAGLEEPLVIPVSPERRLGPSPQRGHLVIVQPGEGLGVCVVLDHQRPGTADQEDLDVLCRLGDAHPGRPPGDPRGDGSAPAGFGGRRPPDTITA